MASDVKWIKITTDIFDDEKVLMIESIPSSDSIIVIWFKLLVLAGKQNNSGVFIMNNRIAYTDEMLASIFRRDIGLVRLALHTFEQFGMIEIVDDVITIPNWGKHQTLDSYEKKKERDRIYQAKRRANQKLLIEKSSDTSSDGHADQSLPVAVSEEERESDIDISSSLRSEDIGADAPTEQMLSAEVPKEPKIPKAAKTAKKEAARFVPPTLEEVTAYASSRQSRVDPRRFYEYFSTPDAQGRTWRDSKGNPVRNWKQKFLTWEKYGSGGQGGGAWSGAPAAGGSGKPRQSWTELAAQMDAEEGQA